MEQVFDRKNFHSICNTVAHRDTMLAAIIQQYGYPPMWTRKTGFATLIHIILEQQVSLASAKAAFVKLTEKLGTITPEGLLSLTDEEMKACYFSRQKMVYARHLAECVISKKLSFRKLNACCDEEVRAMLTRVKGIGTWTADVYLLFALQRTDIFPIGDLAMVNALKKLKQLPADSRKETLMEVAEPWRPYRSIATMLLWHYYICSRNIKH